MKTNWNMILIYIVITQLVLGTDLWIFPCICDTIRTSHLLGHQPKTGENKFRTQKMENISLKYLFVLTEDQREVSGRCEASWESWLEQTRAERSTARDIITRAGNEHLWSFTVLREGPY